MRNNYFQFKQFLVRQDKCAMKVCTDACLFGAWVADRNQNSGIEIKNVLDIGAGTGLLSLMLAQKIVTAEIDAIEIDRNAANQAKENFESSIWKERLHIHHNPVQQFASASAIKYDLIIANPPFYKNDLQSNNTERNIALHSTYLKLDELVSIADLLLKDEGNFFVLLPHHRTENFVQSVCKQFFIKEKVFIKQTPKHDYFRSIFWLTKMYSALHQSVLIIKDEDGNYSKEFIALLKDYYLRLESKT